MQIYVSTAGFGSADLDDLCKGLLSAGVSNIELSSGQYYEDIESRLERLKSLGAHLQLHNYFPVPAKSFVLNFASSNKDTIKKSIALAERAIELSLLVGSRRVSFHAGFLLELQPCHLGAKRWHGATLIERDRGIDAFKQAIEKVHARCVEVGVELLIENNVTVSEAIQVFGANPFLMADDEEILNIFRDLPTGCKLLLDVAHLNVSSRSLSFDRYAAVRELKGLVGGLHLSENDGVSDTNDRIHGDAWFFGCDFGGADFATVEVYGQSADDLFGQVALCTEKFGV